MLISEEIMLLVLDRSGRRRAQVPMLNHALAGGLLLDLLALGRVDVADEPRDGVKAGRLLVLDTSPTRDDLLDGALERVDGQHGRRPQDVVQRLTKGMPAGVLERLARHGAVRKESWRVLGIFPATSWPPTDVREIERLRGDLRQVLVSGRRPTEHETSLVALLQAVDAIPAVLGDVGVGKRELRRRAKEIAAGNAAGAAVHHAVKAIQAAAAGAAAAAAAAGAAGAG